MVLIIMKLKQAKLQKGVLTRYLSNVEKEFRLFQVEMYFM